VEVKLLARLPAGKTWRLLVQRTGQLVGKKAVMLLRLDCGGAGSEES